MARILTHITLLLSITCLTACDEVREVYWEIKVLRQCEENGYNIYHYQVPRTNLGLVPLSNALQPYPPLEEKYAHQLWLPLNDTMPIPRFYIKSSRSHAQCDTIFKETDAYIVKDLDSAYRLLEVDYFPGYQDEGRPTLWVKLTTKKKTKQPFHYLQPTESYANRAYINPHPIRSRTAYYHMIDSFQLDTFTALQKLGNTVPWEEYKGEE